MAVHIPEIFIQDTTDPRVLLVKDISVYDPNTAITIPSLKVYLPNNSVPYYLPFSVGNLNYYTSVSFFGYCGTCLSILPDGIYSVTYSVSPNDILFQTQKFLRTVCTKNKLLAILGDLYTGCEIKNFSVCNFNMNSIDEQISYIQNLIFILDSAEADVKNLKNKQALTKFNWVNAEINKYIYNAVPNSL